MRSWFAMSCVTLCAAALSHSAAAQQPESRTTASAPSIAAQPTPAQPTVLPSVVLPPALDRVLRDYERAWRARDASALVALFTEDGFVLQPGRPPVRGRNALLEAYKGQGGELNLRALAFAAGDSVGYIIGAFGYASRPGDAGKFTLTLRRSADGKWLIASDMDSPNR